MARSQTRAAIEAARDKDAIVSFDDDGNEYTRVRFRSEVDWSVSKLVQEHGFLISRRTTRGQAVELFA